MKYQTRFALGVSALALAVGAPAIAQDADDGEELRQKRVVVTGSFISTETDPFDSASPISNVGPETFDESGILTSSELVRTLPYNTGSENQADALTQGNNVGTANVNLRGLGVGSTLVLVNGRRQTVSGATTNRGDTFVDLNTLMPQIMIGNIEVLKEGAAATYGSDAVAGVVNFRTRNDFEGLEVRGDYQFTTRDDDHSTQSISAIFGSQSDRTSVVGALTYYAADELELRDRPEFPNQTVSSFGNPGSYILTAPSALIPSATPGAFNADPACGGPENPEGINTGAFCLFDFGPNYSLVPEQERFQAYVVAEQEIAEDQEVFFEFGYTTAEYFGGYSTSFPNLDLATISGSHPGNPYGVTVLGFFRPVGNNGLTPGDNRADGFFTDETYRIVAGAKGGLFSTGWDYDLAYTFSRDRRDVQVPDQIRSRLDLALQGLGGPGCDPVTGTPGVGGCQFFNPFGTSLTTVPNDPALIEYLTNTDPQRRRTDLTTIEGVVSGEIAQLPAGPLGAAFGYQYRSEIRVTDSSAAGEAEDLIFLIGDPDARGKRTTDAFFAELAVPIADSESFGEIDAQIALRYEDYSTGQSSTDPKIGIRWSPRENLALRGSWSTAFRAPTLFQITNRQTALQATADPFTGGALPVFLGETARANPDLQPEESETFNLGVSYEPTENIRLNVDYYNVEYDNLISTEIGQTLLIAESAALADAGCTPADLSAGVQACLDARNPNIIRDSVTSRPLRIFTNRENAPNAKTDGWDFSATYFRELGDLGNLTLSNTTTFVNSFEITTAGGVTLEGAGKRNANTPFANPIPEWRSNTTARWDYGNHGVTLVGRYISSYDENGSDGSVIGDVDSWFTFDAQYSYQMDDFFGFGDGTEFTVGAQNIFDEDPPFVSGQTNELGYDTKTHDPRGTMVYFRLKQSFE